MPPATLLEILQNRMSEAAPTGAPAAATSDQTGQAANLIRTKLTGKASPAGSEIPANSNIGEQAVNQQAKAQSQQQQQTGSIAAEDLAQKNSTINQQTDIAKQQELTNRSVKSQQFQNQAQAILGDAARQGKKLTTQSDLDKLEQVAQSIRLNNDQYVNELQTEAQKKNLDNNANFQQEYYSQVFGDSLDMVKDKLSMQDLMSSDDRDFQQKLANIDIATAINLSKTAAKQASAQIGFEGLGSLVSGGARAYDSYDTYSNQQEQQVKAAEQSAAAEAADRRRRNNIAINRSQGT